MIATIRAAADIIRANAELLDRHGYRAAEVIAAIIRMANRMTVKGEYNAHGTAIREFADALLRKAERIDAEENGIRTYVDTDGGFVFSSDGRPTVNPDARALHLLWSDLYTVGLGA